MKKFAFLIAVLVFSGITLLAHSEEAIRTSKIIELKGTVEINISQKGWVAAKLGDILNQGDMIRTKADSYAVLNLDGKGETATVEVKENSQVNLAKLIEDNKAQTQTTLLDLSLGKVLIKAKKLHSDKSKFEVKTPTSIVGVRGTTFAVSVETAE